MSNTEIEPLLDSAAPGYDTVHDPSYDSPPDALHSGFQNKLPEAPSHRKALNWSSAYILVISRVIGSGVFATPGSIVKSTGSIGLTLLLWLVGTILAACGMAVSMEFGCMLPRSGGDKVNQCSILCFSPLRIGCRSECLLTL